MNGTYKGMQAEIKNHPRAKVGHTPEFVWHLLMNLKNNFLLKKSHTCEEGGAHIRIYFWHLLINLKNK